MGAPNNASAIDKNGMATKEMIGITRARAQPNVSAQMSPHVITDSTNDQSATRVTAL